MSRPAITHDAGRAEQIHDVLPGFNVREHGSLAPGAYDYTAKSVVRGVVELPTCRFQVEFRRVQRAPQGPGVPSTCDNGGLTGPEKSAKCWSMAPVLGSRRAGDGYLGCNSWQGVGPPDRLGQAHRGPAPRPDPHARRHPPRRPRMTRRPGAALAQHGPAPPGHHSDGHRNRRHSPARQGRSPHPSLVFCV